MHPGDDPLTLIVAEDSVLLREGLCRLLVESGFAIAGACEDAEGLLACVQTGRPDAVVVDVRLPPTYTDEGLRAAHDIRQRWPDVGVLVLSQYVEVRLAADLLAKGAEGLGYLLKDRIRDIDEFVSAVRRVATGGSSIDPFVVSQLLARRDGNDHRLHLTPRELEVLALVAQGLSNQAIAAKLVVSLRAVEKHVTAIFDKLSLPPASEGHRRVLAVLRFLRG